MLLAPAISRADIAEQKLRWEQRFGPFEELAQAHQLPAPNDTAKTLEGLGPALGLDLVPHSRDRAVPGAARRPPASSLDTRPEEWAAWFTAELARPEDLLAPIPPTVLEWHDAHQDTLEQVRRVLIAWKAPRWEEDLLDAAKAPIPNLQGLTRLNKILSADALVAESLGATARANADLEAAWNLGTSLTDRAEDVSVAVGSSHCTRVAVLLRKLSHPSETWAARLESEGFRAAMLVGMRTEARFFVGLAEGRWSYEEPDAGPVRRWISRRSASLVGVKLLRDLFTIAEELADPPRCDHSLAAGANEQSTWFDDILPDFASAFAGHPCRVDVLALQFELTRRVLALRKIDAEFGAFPAALPGGALATSCPDHAWRWQTDGMTGHLEPVRVGGRGVEKWWAQARVEPMPMECTLSRR